MSRLAVPRIVLSRVRECSPIDGRLLKRTCWRWRVKVGRKICFGGYASLKRDARGDAETLLEECSRVEDQRRSGRLFNGSNISIVRPAAGEERFAVKYGNQVIEYCDSQEEADELIDELKHSPDLLNKLLDIDAV